MSSVTERVAEAPPQVGPPLGLPRSAGEHWRPHDGAVATAFPVRLTGRRSRWVEAAADLHAARDTAGPMLTDGLVLAAVAMLELRVAWLAAAWAVAMVAALYLGHVYAERDSLQTRGVLWYPGRLVTPTAVVTAVAVSTGAASVVHSFVLALTAVAVLTALRCLTWTVLLAARRRGYGLRRALVIGELDLAGDVWRRLVEFPEAGLLPTQLLTFRAARVAGAVERELAQLSIRHVVLVSPGREETPLTATLPRDDATAPYVSVVPALAECFLDPRSATEVGGIPLIPLGRVTRARRHFPGKRLFDLLVSTLLLVLSLPVIAAIAVAVKLDDNGPVLYRQQRVGRGGVSFTMVKFRTMVVGADAMLDQLRDANITDGLLFKVPNDPRVTRVGRWLRSSSLDELPQLWNVLRGDMSMVGPRPVAADPDDFTLTENERHTTRPGITGYWQLSGGPRLSFEEMIRLDLAYIRSWSLWLDVRLVLRTIPAVLHRHGAH